MDREPGDDRRKGEHEGSEVRSQGWTGVVNGGAWGPVSQLPGAVETGNSDRHPEPKSKS